MALPIEAWSLYTGDQEKRRKRSAQAVDSNHVLQFTYDPECRHVVAKVQSSFSDMSYTMNVSIPSLSFSSDKGMHICLSNIIRGPA